MKLILSHAIIAVTAVTLTLCVRPLASYAHVAPGEVGGSVGTFVLFMLAIAWLLAREALAGARLAPVVVITPTEARRRIDWE